MTSGFADDATLSPEQALREVLRLEQRTGALHQRTIGMTWIIWSMINLGIFVSYEAVAFAGPAGRLGLVEYGLAWVPWVTLGTLATVFVWHSLELVTEPVAGAALRVTAIAASTFLILVLGGLAVVALSGVVINGFAWAMMAVGGATAIAGGSGLTTQRWHERRFWIVGGGSLAVLAIGIVSISGRVGYDPTWLLLVLGPAATTVLLFAGGLYTAGQ